MRKLFQKLVFTIALFAIVSPAMAGTGKGGGAISTLGGAVTLTLGALATIKKTDGTEFDAETKEVLNAVQTLVIENQKGLISKEELDTKLKDLNVANETMEQIKAEIIKMDKSIKAMAEISTNEKTQIQSLTKKLMSKLIAQEGEGDVEKLALRLKSLQQDKNGAINLTLKAPIHTGVNTIAPTNDNLEIYRSPREVNRLLNFVTILPGSTNGAVETYTEMFNETGNATVVECGDLKPLIGASFRKNTVNPFKVACHIKECDDVFIYIERLESTLTALLEDELKDAKDAAVLAKIQASANLYNLTTINTTNPNQKDAIIAAIAQVRALNYYPTHIALNPIDKANFEISKASDGHYLFMCGCNADGSMMISTLKVIETNQIPVGSFLVADLTKVNVRMITDVILRMGYGVTVTGVGPVTNVTDDLIHDVVTIVAEQFMSMYIRQLDGNAFVYDTFANVQTAL